MSANSASRWWDAEGGTAGDEAELTRRYEALVERAIGMARKPGVATEAELMALELVGKLIGDRRVTAQRAYDPGAALREPVIDLLVPTAAEETDIVVVVDDFDRVATAPVPPRSSREEPASESVHDPTPQPVWKYDPPAWINPERVVPLGTQTRSRKPGSPIDWTGTDNQRIKKRGVRLPFGAVHLDDMSKLDQLRDTGKDD